MKIKIKKFKKVKSTNDIAIKLIKKISYPMIITSEKQTNGRGRVGKNGFQKKVIFLYLFSLNMTKKKLILSNMQY